jgi:DNA-binding GntR family transcriptional regulator
MPRTARADCVKKKEPSLRNARPGQVHNPTPAKIHRKPEHGASVLTAFQVIRDLIVHGNIAPGTWIVESDLAERLNLSRTPVRAALLWLQREGYVLDRHNGIKSKMLVAPLTREDANELYYIIGHLEGLAGRGAAEKPKRERLELAAQLREFNQRLSAIASGRGGPSSDIFESDRNFHRIIVKAGAGPRLFKLHKAIEPQTERYWRLYASSIINALSASVDEHKAIIEALIAGNPDAVEKGLQKNWRCGAERLGHVIDMFGERGSW